MDTGSSHIGSSASLELTVTEADTAATIGSGDLPVLGTPRLVAWLEAATCAAVAEHLTPGSTTVGTRIDVEHLAASPVGAVVEAAATLTGVDGRVLTFEVNARDAGADTALARGTVTRAVVDSERFLARLSSCPTPDAGPPVR